MARAGLEPNALILGNVLTVTDMLSGTPERVEAAADERHETCGRYQIVGAGCEVWPLTPPESLRAMIRYATEHKPGSFLAGAARAGG